MVRYRKTIVALLSVVVAALTALSDKLGENGEVSERELIAIAVTVLTAVGVYLVPNDRPDDASPGSDVDQSVRGN